MLRWKQPSEGETMQGEMVSAFRPPKQWNESMSHLTLLRFISKQKAVLPLR